MSSLKEIQALQLQSEKVFDYFEEICAIPHGSRNTKAISDYLVAFAKKHDLTWYQDESNNVVIVQDHRRGHRPPGGGRPLPGLRHLHLAQLWVRALLSQLRCERLHEG